MSALPPAEMAVFLAVIGFYCAAAAVGVVQLFKPGRKWKRLLPPLVFVAVVLEVVLLVIRAVALRAVPLAGLFESMLVLTAVFALIYLFFSVVLEQVWFGSIMSWLLLGLVLMAAVVAEPVSRPSSLAATPLAVAHGVTMVVAAAAIAFAAGTALLRLLSARKLKQGKILQVLGRAPNIERLTRVSSAAVTASFVLLSIGLASGLGLASMLQAPLAAWLADVKVAGIIAAWVLLGAILILKRVPVQGAAITTAMTTAAFILVLFAVVGATILKATRHDFSGAGRHAPTPPAEARQ